MESFFAGLLGFLVGKGVAPADAQSIVKALEQYLGFEPPVGLTGFVLSDMTAGQRKKSTVVVRGKTYNAHALEALTKYDEVSILAKSGDYLEVARTITHMKDVGTLGRIDLVKVLEELTLLKKLEELTLVKKIEVLDTLGTLTTLGTITNPVKIITESLDNILIDKLKVGAYTERRSTFSNKGATPAGWLDADGVRRRGKFFPRGCRGFMRNVEIYCKDMGTSGGTITVYVAPNVGMGPVASRVITVSAGGGEMWRTAVFDMMWNYDSLFIWVYGSSDDMRVVYDEGTPHDAYRSDDSGVSWYYSDFRTWFRSYITGETCSDVPVSGTINTMEIPGSATGTFVDEEAVPTATETSIVKINGCGTITRVAVVTQHDDIELRFYVDGVLMDRTALIAWGYLMPCNLQFCGHTPTTPQIQLLSFIDGGVCSFAINIPFKFTRSFEAKAYHERGVDTGISVGLTANLLR